MYEHARHINHRRLLPVGRSSRTFCVLQPPVDVAILERLAEDDYSGSLLALLLRR